MAIRKGPRGSKQLGEMHEKGAKPANTRRREGPQPGLKWWKLDEDQIAPALMSTLAHIKKNRGHLDQEALTYSRLYSGRAPGSGYGQVQGASSGVHPVLAGRLAYNIYGIVFDTITAKVTKENLSTQFVTNGGDYRQQRRAKKLTQFADGITYETKMDALGAEIFRDSLMFPCGVAHTFADWAKKRVKTERVLWSELFVDPVDGFYGEPRQMHRVKMVDREMLCEAFPEKEAAIMANRDTGPDLAFMPEAERSLVDQIAVGESWHLPSGVDDDGEPTDDGRHVLYIANAVLTPEDERGWKKHRFPFSVMRWKPDTEGWHGIPLGRDLVGAQVEMNHLLLMFQRAFRAMAAFRIWVETGTVPDQHFTDKIATILHGPRGSQPPQFLTPPALNAQYFTHFQGIRERAFETARISQLSAVGQKPAGLDSGEAQRVYHDIEGEGFSTIQKAHEAFRLDVTTLQLDVVRDIFAAEKSYKLRAPVSSSTLPGAKFLRSIDWKDVRLDEDEYILRGYSTSSLPSTPAGRLSTVQDMMRAGLIDPDTGRKLLNFPDLAQVQSLLGAAEDWIVSVLDKIVDEGKSTPPDPYMNLAMAERLAIQELCLGSANGMEEEKLDALRSWIDQVQLLKKKAAAQAQADAAAQAAAAGGPGAGGAVQGVGAPPPVSPMLPPGAQAA